MEQLPNPANSPKGDDKAYDLIIYGATGFVGQRAVEYLAKHPQQQQLRWAIAGRDLTKLEQIKAHLGSSLASISILVADSGDPASVDAMVAQTRVLLSTAGPFSLYGSPIVDACVRFKTHYVDITGETVWVRDLIDRYHDQTSADGTRIIPCCGFDSVPADLGCYLAVRHLHALGVTCRQVKSYYQMYGGVNGGTIASAINLYESGQIEQAHDPFLLNPIQNYSPAELVQNRDPSYPSFDPSVGTWVGPFVMGAVNTRVVRRSAALFAEWGEPYGPNFYYQEYLKYNPPFAQAKAVLVSGVLALFDMALGNPITRRLLKPILPKPKTGPSEETMNSGWFTTELLGTAATGDSIKVTLKFQGDPGNRATVCFVCEAALGLALEPQALPGGSQRGGLLTPATGLGDVLLGRLRTAGLKIEIS
jgi:short subunit dehydrogenase-like uncharacterized protein